MIVGGASKELEAGPRPGNKARSLSFLQDTHCVFGTVNLPLTAANADPSKGLCPANNTHQTTLQVIIRHKLTRDQKNVNPQN